MPKALLSPPPPVPPVCPQGAPRPPQSSAREVCRPAHTLTAARTMLPSEPAIPLLTPSCATPRAVRPPPLRTPSAWALSMHVRRNTHAHVRCTQAHARVRWAARSLPSPKVISTPPQLHHRRDCKVRRAGGRAGAGMCGFWANSGHGARTFSTLFLSRPHRRLLISVGLWGGTPDLHKLEGPRAGEIRSNPPSRAGAAEGPSLFGSSGAACKNSRPGGMSTLA